jgi:hypothetical protein
MWAVGLCKKHEGLNSEQLSRHHHKLWHGEQSNRLSIPGRDSIFIFWSQRSDWLFGLPRLFSVYRLPLAPS